MTLSIQVKATWVILIGMGEFQDFPAIPAVKNNLARLRALWTNPEIVGVPENQVLIIENQTHLYNTLVAKIKDLPRLNSLIVYYVGHGIYEPKHQHLYLAVVDTRRDDPKTALAFEDLLTLTQKKAKNLIYLLDCCFSGKAMKSVNKQLQKNISILTATLPNQNAIAPPDKAYTAFTDTLLALLEQGFGNDPAFTLHNIYEELKIRLPHQGYPEPWHNDYEHTGPVYFAKNHAYRPHNINQYWKMPPRNLYFTGRSTFLEQLEQAFLSVPRVALTGLAGIGKTQTAIEYAYRHKHRYRAVLWVNAENRVLMDSDLEEFVSLLGLARQQDQALNLIAVKNWLLREEQWLLILDNVEGQRAEDIIPWCREVTSFDKRFILMTSQCKTLDTQVYSLPLESFSTEEGTEFFLQATGQLEKELNPEEQTALHQLGTELGWLPLALDVMAASVHEYQCGFQYYYTQLYQPETAKWLDKASTDHPKSILAAFSIAFHAIQKENPQAMEILRVCAFLAAEAIPERVFDMLNPLEFNQAIAIIMRYSLLQRDPKTQSLSMHRLVQKILRYSMDEATQRAYAERVVVAVNRIFPKVDEVVDWLTCVHLLPCGLQCVEWIEKWEMESVEVGRLLSEVSEILYKQGRYPLAKSLVERSLALREKLLDADHPDVATSLNNLANLYSDKGEYNQALPLHQRALAILEKVLGEEHPDVATSLNGLAVLYSDKGEYNQAFPLYQRALALREKVLGEEHPEVASSLKNLADLYRRKGEYDQALPLYQRALAIYKKVLGEEHPHVAISLSCLALLYSDKGECDKALPFYQRALALQEKVLGEEHPEVATSLNNLATLYFSKGEYNQALPLYQRALVILEKVLGEEHPNVATNLDNLASLYFEKGEYDQALPLHQRALALREKVLGEEHPDVAISLNNLATLYYRKGEYDQALPLYQRALVIYQQKLPDHPWKRKCEENYAKCLKEYLKIHRSVGRVVSRILKWFKWG